MPTLTEIFNICDSCAYAPSLCGNEQENCAAYIQRHGIQLSEKEGTVDDSKAQSKVRKNNTMEKE